MLPETWAFKGHREGIVATAEAEVPARGFSSLVTTCAPCRCGTVTATISSSSRPASIASIARRCESTAYSSISRRDTPSTVAWFSATSIMVHGSPHMPDPASLHSWRESMNRP